MNYVITYSDITLKSHATWICPVCLETQNLLRKTAIDVAYATVTCKACLAIFKEIDPICRRCFFLNPDNLGKEVQTAQKHYSGPASKLSYKALPGITFQILVSFKKEKDFFLWSWTCPRCDQVKTSIEVIPPESGNWFKKNPGKNIWCQDCNFMFSRTEKYLMWIGLHLLPLHFVLEYVPGDITRMDLLFDQG